MADFMGYFASDAIWVLFECGVFQCSKTVMYIITIIPYVCLLITAWLWFIYCEIVPVTIPQLIARADEKLYEMKKNR